MNAKLKLLEQYGLSKRERDVVEVVLTGVSNKICGDKLGISEKGVKFHLTQIYKKVGLKSRSLLIANFGYRV